MVRISAEQKKRVEEIARSHGLHFIRIFGSFLVNSELAQDVDLAIAAESLTFDDFAALVSELEAVFGRPVDLVQLKRGMNPVLVLEIAGRSEPLWEEPETGRSQYIEVIDPLCAVAQDEVLAFPMSMKVESLKKKVERLRGA